MKGNFFDSVLADGRFALPVGAAIGRPPADRREIKQPLPISPVEQAQKRHARLRRGLLSGSRRLISGVGDDVAVDLGQGLAAEYVGSAVVFRYLHGDLDGIEVFLS